MSAANCPNCGVAIGIFSLRGRFNCKVCATSLMSNIGAVTVVSLLTAVVSAILAMKLLENLFDLQFTSDELLLVRVVFVPPLAFLIVWCLGLLRVLNVRFQDTQRKEAENQP